MITETETVSNTGQPDDARLHMRQALALAAKRRGFCAPNPAVGALLCQDGQVLGRGYHHGAGTDHAEIMALKEAGAQATGATMYVTLEPCGHWGRTPPCVDAIITHGVATLYYAYADPNPVVQEQAGLARLRAAGVRCYQLVMPEVQDFYQSYAYYVQHKRPWVTTKLAMSLDAKIAGPNGRPVTITGAEAKRYTHERRYFADAVLTSVRTVLADDPLLNVRLSDQTYAKHLAVIDRHAQIPLDARCLQAASSVTLYYVSAPSQVLAKLADRGVRCVPVPAAPGGVDLGFVMTDMGRYAHDVWVESGPVLQHALAEGGWVASHLRYIAPYSLGSEATGIDALHALAPACPMVTEWWPLGQDICCQLGYEGGADSLPFAGKIGYHWGLSMVHEIEVYEANNDG